MSVNPTPLNLVEQIAALERRIRDLETSTTNSRQGMTFQDTTGRVRVRIGPTPGGGYGVVVYNSAGTVTFTQTNP
jgi:hypothetical protein